MNQTRPLKELQFQPLKKEKKLINPNYFDHTVRKDLKSKFQNSIPNQYLELNNFLNEKIAYRLLNRFPPENMFKRKKSDKKMIESNFDLLDPTFNKLKKIYAKTEDSFIKKMQIHFFQPLKISLKIWAHKINELNR